MSYGATGGAIYAGNGSVSLEFPEEVRAVGVATSGVDIVTAQLSPGKGGVKEPRPVKVFATAQIDGRKVRVPVVPCDEYEQAFAWKHLVPAESFLLTSPGGGKPRRPPQRGR